MPIAISSPDRTRGRVRFTIVAMLFAITMVNYADRATLAITGPVISKDLGFSHVQMGFIFSAFGWSYVIGQLPGGWLLDRFGSKAAYFLSIVLWSFFTLLQGGVWMVGAAATVYALFALRLMVGFAEAPSFPANGRIVAAGIPPMSVGTASAIFNSAQYFATVVFAPVMGFITVTFGWPGRVLFHGRARHRHGPALNTISASEFRIFWQIVVPPRKLGLVALGVFTFREAWDMYIWPLIIVSKDLLRTLPLGISLFMSSYGTAWDQLMAIAVLGTLPMIVLFFVLQRAFIQGIAVTGLKE